MKKRMKKEKEEIIILISFSTIPIKLIFAEYQPIITIKSAKELIETLSYLDPQKQKEITVILCPDVNTFLKSEIYKILEKKFIESEDLEKEIEQFKTSLINTERQILN